MRALNSGICKRVLLQRWKQYIQAHSIRSLSGSPTSRASKGKRQLPDGPARTRFAPSPTGYLHLGSLRTALFNFLLAKKTGGQYLLRLEDTDSKRTVQGAEAKLYEDLRWAGLQWDEGPEIGGLTGPYRQSERTQIYQDHADQLLRTPHAYRCFCSTDRLEQLAQQRRLLGLPTDYDRTCESLSDGESAERAHRGDPHVVRLRAPNSYPVFTDLVYGTVGKSNAGFNLGVTHKHGEIVYEDPVLLKSDGRPTYHLANVVDDHLMNITHVVRATEWLSSTPKHLALYDAFGWKPPQFAHVGLLTDDEGQKLSKRKMDIGIQAFRDEGILRPALINFAALLGWSHDRKNDVMDLEELINEFNLRFTKGNTTVTFEKLSFLQRAHAARASSNPSSSAFGDMLDAVHAIIMQAMKTSSGGGLFISLDATVLRARIYDLLKADARNYESPAKFWARNQSFFLAPQHRGSGKEGSFNNPSTSSVAEDELSQMMATLWRISEVDWNAYKLDNHLRRLCLDEEARKAALPDEKVKLQQPKDKERYKALCKYVRWALLGGHDGPGVVDTLLIMGRDEAKDRSENARNSSNV